MFIKSSATSRQNNLTISAEVMHQQLPILQQHSSPFRHFVSIEAIKLLLGTAASVDGSTVSELRAA